MLPMNKEQNKMLEKIVNQINSLREELHELNEITQDKEQKKTFKKIINRLDSLRKLLTSSQGDNTVVSRKKNNKHYCIDENFRQKLIADGRSNTEKYLRELNSNDLGTILRKIGGSSVESKRPKEDIIKNILYKLFDFSSGHDTIKSLHF